MIIDPLVAYLSARYSTHRDQDVRRALAPLAQLAADCRSAFVLVRHLNKTRGGPALYRGGGSIGMIGAARSGLLLAADPGDPDVRVLASTKCNLGKTPPSLAFKLESVPGTDVARVVWLGESRHTAASLLAAQENEGERAQRAGTADWLREVLAAGPVPAREVEERARQAGIATGTLRRARERLDVETRRVGFGADGAYVWSLPGAAPPVVATDDPPPPPQPPLWLDDAPAPDDGDADTEYGPAPRRQRTCLGCGCPVPPECGLYCRECRPNG